MKSASKSARCDADPSEGSWFRIAYDSDNLYVAFRAYDSDPSAVVATELRRDADMESQDHVVFMFDTFTDRRNAFGFAMNASGALHDARVENNANWGLEVIRRIRRKNERMRWANISQNRGDNYVAAFGDMAGLEGLRQGMGLDIVPTFSVQTRENRLIGDSDQVVVTGGDVTYRITPSLTAQVTINSDFSDAPVDQVQNNLGRFSLFYPETRDFFLNDADIFQFGGLNQENGIPFFSRRMGIIDTGEALDLKFGAKMTGRVGNLNLGLISTHIEGKHELDAQDLTVFRASTGVLNESRIGMIVTDGDANSNNSSRLYGSDFQYRNSNLPGGNVITSDVWVQQSDNPGINGDDLAYGVKVDYPNDRIQANLAFREIQPNFDPKLGFVNRAGIQQWGSEGRLRKRFGADTLLRLIDWGWEWERTTDMAGRLQTEEVELKVIEFANQMNDRIELSWEDVREVLDAPFEIADGIVLPAGDHHYSLPGFRLQASNARKLSGEFEFSHGDFWTGTVTAYEGYFEFRPSPRYYAGVNYEVIYAELPQGDFDFAVTRLNLDFNLSPRVMWQNLMQHNSVSKTVGWNSRLRWEVQPGNIWFLVLNQGWEIEEGSYMPINTGFASKVRWTYRF